jgi:hydroxymethylglutaryl-CoA reductase (NADPH)
MHNNNTKDKHSVVINKIHAPAMCTPVCSDPDKNVSIVDTVDYTSLSDDQVAALVVQNVLKDHLLEKKLTPTRAVAVRRCVVRHNLSSLHNNGDALVALPYKDALDYDRVHGANCEIVVGFVPIPVGIVGPLTVNNETVYVPMATTEGCLVASTNRGAKAISAGGGAYCEIVKDGITRAPCVRMPSAMEAAALKIWCERPEHLPILRIAFESTTSFGKLLSVQATIAGKNVYIRLVCFAGDAMGMNMVSKGSLAVIDCLREHFPSLELVALSGNMCTDKKAAATNWLEGRGKSVVAEATIPKEIVRSVLKTTPKALVETNLHKNLIGSAMAGTIGGFNAQ